MGRRRWKLSRGWSNVTSPGWGMLDLINTTHSRYYKLYQKEKLINVMGSRTGNPTHLANLHEKEEQMRQKCVLLFLNIWLVLRKLTMRGPWTKRSLLLSGWKPTSWPRLRMRRWALATTSWDLLSFFFSIDISNKLDHWFHVSWDDTWSRTFIILSLKSRMKLKKIRELIVKIIPAENWDNQINVLPVRH